MSSRVNSVCVYSCVPYATPIKALHHAHAYPHSGFSVDAGACIEAHDRAALERLREAGSDLVYRRARTAIATLACWHRIRR